MLYRFVLVKNTRNFSDSVVVTCLQDRRLDEMLSPMPLKLLTKRLTGADTVPSQLCSKSIGMGCTSLALSDFGIPPSSLIWMLYKLRFVNFDVLEVQIRQRGRSGGPDLFFWTLWPPMFVNLDVLEAQIRYFRCSGGSDSLMWTLWMPRFVNLDVLEAQIPQFGCSGGSDSLMWMLWGASLVNLDALGA